MESIVSSMEAMVTDRAAIDAMLEDCARYWRASGIRRSVVRDMRQELEQHLVDATGEGRDLADVVGHDIAGFATDWALEKRGPDARLPSWDETVRGRRRGFGWMDVGILFVVTAVIAVALVTRGEGGGDVDNETWRFIWVGAAVFLGFAEVVTAGFFMLPFAAGAVIAAILAFAGVAPAIQLLVFIVSSLLALIALQRFVRHGDEHRPMVGANRFVDQRATVLEEIDRVSGAGRVRMDTEVWRATTEGGPIAAGTEVRVVDVRGARLVVEPTE